MTFGAKPLLFFVLVIGATLCFRLPLADGPRDLLVPLNKDVTARPWKLLLPFDLGQERYRWTTTGMAPIGLLNRWVPAPTIFVLLLLLLVVSAYMLSWYAFRSVVFSTTLALCMGFSSHFNCSYYHNGSHVWPLYTTYLLINLFCLFFIGKADSFRWRVAFTCSLVVLALCWEVWLDYLVFLLALATFAFLRCRVDPQLSARFRSRILFVGTASLIIGVVYLAIKLPFSREHFSPGHESDTIFTYSSPVMACEDVVSNLFSYPYLAITNYLPSWFVSSNSLYHYGANRLIQEQHGYHAQVSHLVPMHHLFFWHFYAGCVFVGLAWCAVRTFARFRESSDLSSIVVFSLMCLLLTGFSTHLVIKFRPYLSVPLFAYKCLNSVTAVGLLVSYLAMIAAQRFRDQRKYGALIVAVWSFLIVASVERCAFQDHLAKQVACGEFPHPINSFRQLTRDKPWRDWRRRFSSSARLIFRSFRSLLLDPPLCPVGDITPSGSLSRPGLASANYACIRSARLLEDLNRFETKGSRF